jgi:hypothetical protein
MAKGLLRTQVCPSCRHETAYDPWDCPRFLRFTGPPNRQRKAGIVHRVRCAACGRERDVEAGRGEHAAAAGNGPGASAGPAPRPFWRGGGRGGGQTLPRPAVGPATPPPLPSPGALGQRPAKGKGLPRYGPPLTEEQILAWADARHARTGHWPRAESGAILDAPGDNWYAVNHALAYGYRGLPGGDSLAKLLDRHRRRGGG